jgi:2,3-bisphosphoglycerate-independent phosphoglycerate mutase
VELSKAANTKVKLTSHPATFDFKNTLGHRAVLVIKSMGKPLSGKISNTDPAYSIVNGLGVAETTVDMHLKTCLPLADTEAARMSADLVNEFTNKTNDLWENHPINVKRAKEGKLKANVVLSRDAGSQLPHFFSINERYKVNFAALADMHAESGIAHLAGMESSLLPPPTGNIERDCEIRVSRLLEALPRHDCFYIHLKGPDEPGHDGSCQKKTDIISAIDKYFFGKLLPQIDLNQTLFCITADHATPCILKVHSDTPVPLLISGGSVSDDDVGKFCEKECAKGSLGTLDYGFELMPKLMKLLKNN